MKLFSNLFGRKKQAPMLATSDGPEVHNIMELLNELPAGSQPKPKNIVFRILKAAHKFGREDDQQAVIATVSWMVGGGLFGGVIAIEEGFLAGTGLGVVGGAVVGAMAGVVIAFVFGVILFWVLSGTEKEVSEKERTARFNSCFHYTFFATLLLLALSPIVFPLYPIVALPFLATVGTYFFFGVRGARKENKPPPVPATQEEVDKLVTERVLGLVKMYRPEVEGEKSQIERDIAELKNQVKAVLDLIAVWKVELENPNGDPELAQAQIDRLQGGVDKAEQRIEALKKEQKKMLQAFRELEARLDPFKSAAARYFHSQRTDELLGEISELTQRSWKNLVSLKRKIDQDVRGLMAALDELRLLASPGQRDGGSIDRLFADAGKAGRESDKSEHALGNLLAEPTEELSA